jgi:hypothetical protein
MVIFKYVGLENLHSLGADVLCALSFGVCLARFCYLIRGRENTRLFVGLEFPGLAWAETSVLNGARYPTKHDH